MAMDLPPSLEVKAEDLKRFRFRATGDGWQTRVDAVLQDWLKKHKLPA